MKEIPMIPAHDIMASLSRTPAGESLDQLFRWGFFRSDETDAMWRDMLGATSFDLSHSKLIYGLGRTFLAREEERFSLEEQQTFLLGLLVHDFGEATIDGADCVGDVPAQLKTDEDGEKEFLVAQKVIDSLDVDDESRQKMKNAYEQVAYGKNKKLYDAYRAIETTEYVMTALKVYQNGCRRRADGLQGIAQEKSLVATSLARNIPIVLREYAYQYPNSIGRYLQSVAPLVDEAHMASRESLDGEKRESFEYAWASFKESILST